MIDEAALSALVREAGDAVEVPAEGPARVVAASKRQAPLPLPRSGRPPLGRRSTPGTSSARGHDASVTAGIGRKGVAIALAAVVLLFVAVGVASRHHSSSSSASMSAGTATTLRSLGEVAGASTTIAAGVAGSSGSGSTGEGASSGGGAAAASPAAKAADEATTIPPGSGVAPLATQVIKTGSLGIVVKKGQVGATVDSLTTLASGLGGYVQNTQASTAGASPTATVTLRVPVANFTPMVTQAEALGKVTLLTTSGQDVTAQSVDLAAQIQALQASRDQFLQILTKAQTIGDILSVEQQISGLQTQINQLQGQQKVLNDQTSYSTLTVSVAQPATAVIVPPPPPRQPSGLSAAWAHARHSFTHGFESVVSASGGLAVFLLCAAAVGLILWLVWKVARRHLV